MSKPAISLATGNQSLHIYLPEGELRAYDIPATFRAESGHFRGETTYVLDGINDLTSLHAYLLDLDRVAGGEREYEYEKSWSPDERTIFLTFTLSRSGHLRVEASLQDASQDAELRVRLNADQSYLSDWIRAVEEVVGRVHLYL